MEVHRYSFGFALMIIMILLPKNVMSQDFRLKLYTIDSEWISRDTTEVDFLRYRILKYFWKSNSFIIY